MWLFLLKWLNFTEIKFKDEKMYLAEFSRVVVFLSLKVTFKLILIKLRLYPRFLYSGFQKQKGVTGTTFVGFYKKQNYNTKSFIEQPASISKWHGGSYNSIEKRDTLKPPHRDPDIFFQRTQNCDIVIQIPKSKNIKLLRNSDPYPMLPDTNT